jgi:hypothetical protein
MAHRVGLWLAALVSLGFVGLIIAYDLPFLRKCFATPGSELVCTLGTIAGLGEIAVAALITYGLTRLVGRLVSPSRR